MSPSQKSSSSYNRRATSLIIFHSLLPPPFLDSEKDLEGALFPMLQVIQSTNLILGLLAFGLGLASCSSPNPTSPKLNISRSLPDPEPYKIIRKQKPTLLSFEELVAMAESLETAQASFKKADKLFSSPFVDNTHYFQEGLPKPRLYETIGPALRVSTWNIEKSIHTSEIGEMLTSQDSFRSFLHAEALRQRNALAKAISFSSKKQTSVIAVVATYSPLNILLASSR